MIANSIIAAAGKYHQLSIMQNYCLIKFFRQLFYSIKLGNQLKDPIFPFQEFGEQAGRSKAMKLGLGSCQSI